MANPTSSFLLTLAQMRRLSPCFLLSHGIPRVRDRRVLSGIIYVIRHGLRWRDAPSAYGPYRPSSTASSAGTVWACSTASSRP